MADHECDHESQQPSLRCSSFVTIHECDHECDHERATDISLHAHMALLQLHMVEILKHPLEYLV
jgi:hypothetical protein